ncbi:hypothetical protein AMK16_31575 [Streptomyces sp. CB00455]|nr:hypothetical protein AMK16_31575 [Streptomyces sp. CB00455]
MPGPVADPVADPVPAAPPRRRGSRRTTLLIAGAAVLGVLAGTITGYAVQYHRAPTPLAPLAQQRIDTPAPRAVNESTSRRSINVNRWHKTDEDLGKMLLEAPGGAKVLFSGYESPDEYAADFFERPDLALGSMVGRDVKRIVSLNWSEDDHNLVEIRLIQFRNRSGAASFQQGQSEYMSDKKFAGNSGADIPGVPSDFGHTWVDSEAHEKPGYYPIRGARALARRGDIVMDIHYSNKRGSVDASTFADLAKRQMERL